jgi:hypothetical protein
MILNRICDRHLDWIQSEQSRDDVKRSIDKALTKIKDFNSYTSVRLVSPPFAGDSSRTKEALEAGFGPKVIMTIALWKHKWLRDRVMLTFNPDSSKHMAWMRKLVNFKAQLKHVEGGQYPQYNQSSDLNVVKHDLLANSIMWLHFFRMFNTTANYLEDKFKMSREVVDYLLELKIPYSIKIDLSTCLGVQETQSGGAGDGDLTDDVDLRSESSDILGYGEDVTLSPEQDSDEISLVEADALYSLVIRETRPEEIEVKDLIEGLSETNVVSPDHVLDVIEGSEVSDTADDIIDKLSPGLEIADNSSHKDLIMILVSLSTIVILSCRLNALRSELESQRAKIDERLNALVTNDCNEIDSRIEQLESENTRLQRLCSGTVGFVAADLASQKNILRIVEKRLSKERQRFKELKHKHEMLKAEDHHNFQIDSRQKLIANYNKCLRKVELCNKELMKQNRTILSTLDKYEANRKSDMDEVKRILGSIRADTEQIKWDQNIFHLISAFDSLSSAHDDIKRVNQACRERFKMRFGYPYWTFAIIMRAILAWVSLHSGSMGVLNIGWRIMEVIERRLYKEDQELFQSRATQSDKILAETVKPLALAAAKVVKGESESKEVEEPLKRVVENIGGWRHNGKNLSFLKETDLNYEDGVSVVTEAMRSSWDPHTQYTKEEFDRFYEDITGSGNKGVVASNSK